jgi:glycosyltransferase involved in cell wall biosynthesis
MSQAKFVKVLIVAPALPILGGQTVQAQRLLEKFRAEPNLQADLQPINPQFFPALQKIKYVRTVLTTIKYLFDLFVKIPRYDVIHIFSASYFSFLLAPTPAVLISKLFGKKTVLNYRSGEAEDHLKRWRTAIRTIRLFDKIIVPSGYLVDVFAKFGLKAETIYNFVDTQNYQFRERNPLQPVFLSNRNFEKLYNVECVLRAFAVVQRKYENARLIVAGDGAERENLHQSAKDLQLKNVEFLGRVTQKEMPELYNRADIYLNSPNIDNMPNSIIEAFASGTAVVSTDAGGIPYICESGETALLVAKNDCEALARAAIRLLEDEKLAQKIINTARENCVKYSWENVRGDWLHLYQSLASEKIQPRQ